MPEKDNVLVKDTKVSMKRFFKSPKDLQAMNFKDYQTKRFKKILGGELVNVPFIYVTDFPFQDREAAPMVFLGPPNTFWKKACKDYKRSKTYAAGICSKKDGKLLLEITSGKGKNALNLKKINKILLKKLGLIAEFAGDGSNSNFDNSEEDNLSNSTIISRIEVEIGFYKAIQPSADIEERIKKIKAIKLLIEKWNLLHSDKENPKEKDSKEKAYINTVEKQLAKAIKEHKIKAEDLKHDSLDKLDELAAVSVTTNIVSRIQVELGFYKAIPQKDKKERLEKIRTIQLLIREWGMDYSEDKDSKEKKYIAKVENLLKAHLQKYNNANLQKSNLDELVQDFKEYQTDRKEYEEEYKATVHSLNDNINILNSDLDFPEVAYKSFFQELQIQLANIKNWRRENQKISDKLKKELDNLELSIRKEQQDLATKVPDVEKLDINQQKIQVIADALQKHLDKKIKFKKEQSTKFDQKAQEQYVLESYRKLKGLELDALNWETAHPDAIKNDKTTLGTILDSIRRELKELNSDIPKSELVDNYEIQEYKDAFAKYVKHRDGILTKLDPKKPEKIIAYSIELYNSLDQMMSAIRLWKRENPKASKLDKKTLAALEQKIHVEFKNIENLIPQEHKDKLYEGKGYNPQELENLAEHSKLPKINTGSGALDLHSNIYDQIIDCYEFYNNLAFDDIEAKRRTLFTMTKEIELFENESSISDLLLRKKESKDVNKIKAVVFKILSNLSAFAIQRDNYLEINDNYRKFKLYKTQFLNYKTLFLDQEKIDKSLLELNEDLKDDLEDLIDIIETLTQEWQRLHTHLSGFGTKEKNKTVEIIRKDIHAFAIEKALVHDDPTAVAKTKKDYLEKDKHYAKVDSGMVKYLEEHLQFNLSKKREEISRLQGLISTFDFHASLCIENDLLIVRKNVVQNHSKTLEKHLAKIKNEVDPKVSLNKLKAINTQITQQLGAIEKASKSIASDKEALAKAKKEDKKEALEDKIALNEKAKINHNLHLMQFYTNWGEEFKKWEDSYKKATTAGLKNYKKENNELLKLKKKFDADKNKATKLLTSKEAKDEELKNKLKKANIFAEIEETFKIAAFKYNATPNQKEDRLKLISELERKIKTWDNISVRASSNQELLVYQEEISTLEKIQTILTEERNKFEKNVKVRPDVLFENLKLQFDQLDKVTVTESTTQSIIKLQKAIAIWKKKHPNPMSLDCRDNYKTIEKMEAALKKKEEGPCVIFLLAKQFEKLKARMLKNLKSYEGNKLGIDEEALKALKLEFEQQLKKPKEDANSAVKSNDIPKITKALKALEIIENKIAESIREKLVQSNLAQRKKEQLVLAPFDGLDVYHNFENVKGSIPKKDKIKIKATINKAVERAKKIQELGGSISDTKRMLEHIPITFWPDSFIESMRLWEQAEEAFYGKQVDNVLTGKDALLGAEDTATNTAIALESVTELLNSGSFEVDNPNDPKSPISLNLLTGGGKVAKKGVTEKKAKKESASAAVLGDVSASLGILSSFIGTADDIKNIHEAEGAKERALEVYHLIINSTEKLVNTSTAVLDSSLVSSAAEAAKVDQNVKIASSVLTGVALIIKSIKDIEKAGKDGYDVSLVQKKFVPALTTTVETLVTAGSTLTSLTKIVAGAVKIGLGAATVGGQAAGMVGGVAGVVGGALSTLSDGIELGKLIHQTYKDVVERNKISALKTIANQQDSIMKHALECEERNMNLKIFEDSVNIIGQSIELTGSATSTVGSAISMVPEPEVMAAGTVVAITGTGIKIFGKVLKLGGKTILAVVKEAQRQEVERLLELARKGDPYARIEILRNSRKYAQMFLSLGVTQDPKDPIALEYCIQHGITHKDLGDEATATKILEKLMKGNGASLDETSISKKLSNTTSSISKGIKAKFKSKEAPIVRMDAKNLSFDVMMLSLEFKKLKKFSVSWTKNSDTKKIVTQVVDLKETLGEVDGILDSNINDLYKNFKEINVKMSKNPSDEKFDEAMEIESEIEDKEAFSKAIKESLVLLEELKLN